MCDIKSDCFIIERIVHNVVAFYQGAINYNEAFVMPLTQLYKAENHAARIAKESRKAARKKTHG